ncbi:MAG: tetratricopeptide repeat protein, partial [Anaerolineales bacterium]
MAKERDVLKQLTGAETLEERTWIITDQLLSGVSQAVREATLAVAVPHWFNEDVLRALLPEQSDEIGSVYEQLVEFSFVEPHGTRGYRLHELTCKAVIGHLSKEKPGWYKELRQRAHRHFEMLPGDNEQIEAIYHEFVFDEVAAVGKLLNLFWDLDYREETAAMSLLLDYIGEHEGWLAPQTNLWLRYLNGRRLVVARDREQAVKILDPLTTEATDTPLEPWVLIELAKMKERAGDTVTARGEYKRALALAQAFQDDRCIARACGCLGDSLSRGEQFEEAIKYYEDALAVDRKRKDQRRECEQLRGLGDIYLRRKWWKAAEEYYRNSLKLAQSLSDVTLEAWALNRLGRLEEDMQHWDAAIEWYQQSRELFEHLNQYGNVATVIRDIGDVLKGAKRYDQAKAAYQQAADTYREIGDRVEEAGTFNRMG